MHSMDFAGYEDSFGPVTRRFRRAGRAFRWAVKSVQRRRRRLLLETRWRLGDEVVVSQVFTGLRARYPGDFLSVLTYFPELYENNPYVDFVNEIPGSPDRYILLRGVDRTVARRSYYEQRLGISLAGIRPRLYFENWDCGLVAELPAGSGPLVALAPGTTWPTKAWLPERWRALALALVAQGCRIVELGRGQAPLGLGANLVDRTTVREAACVLRRADLLISCDSGLMHLALAAGTAVVALFGPTDPTILVEHEPGLTPVLTRSACRGYWNRPGPEPRTDVCPLGHTCCLEEIGVDEVLRAAGQRLPGLD